MRGGEIISGAQVRVGSEGGRGIGVGVEVRRVQVGGRRGSSKSEGDDVGKECSGGIRK